MKRLKNQTAFDILKYHKIVLDNAYQKMQIAKQAEIDALITSNYPDSMQIPNKQSHIRHKNQTAKEYLETKKFLRKEASRDWLSELLRFKVCVKQYANIPNCSRNTIVALSGDQIHVHIFFNLLDSDINEGHYQVNLISGDIVHLREYGAPTNEVVTLLTRKMSKMQIRA